MQPRKVKQRESDIAEAAEKTGMMIRGLQSRLLGSTEEIVPPVDENAALEKQLQEYFATWPGEENAGAGSLSRIRNQVIDGVAERILRGWQQDGKTPSENEVIDRLVDGVLEILIANGSVPERKTPSLPSRAAAAAQLTGRPMRS